MEGTFNNILSNELIFLIKYLEGKTRNREKFDQLIIVANGFKVNLHQFMDDALSISGSLYIRTVKKSDNYYTLELTDEGINVLKFITYDQRIIRKSILWKFLVFLRWCFVRLISKPIKFIPTLFKWIFSNTTAKIILFLAALAGGIVAAIQIYKWYTTGEI